MSVVVKVLKFGGSSLADLKALHYCASLIKKERDQGVKLVVVASAMGSQTDKLLDLAYSVDKTPPQRELDMLLSTGERVSCALLAMALHKLGVKALSLTGSQCGILTDDRHQHAEILDIKCDRISSSLKDWDVVLVAGFQGVSSLSKEITTLGRGGSDLTAVALSHKLKAKACYLYTDVNGMMTLNPKEFLQAKTVSQVSWNTAYTLSCLGAEVLHYRASLFALKNKTPLYVLNTKDPEGSKTLVEGSLVEEANNFFITYKSNQTLVEVKVTGEGKHQDVYKNLLDFFWQHDETPTLALQKKIDDKSSSFKFALNHSLTVKLESFLRNSSKTLDLTLKEKESHFFVVSLVSEDYTQDSNLYSKVSRLLEHKFIFMETDKNSMRIGVKTDSIQKLVGYLYNNLVK